MSSTHTAGAGMHRALPPPLLKIKKCMYRYDFIVAVQRENNIFASLSSPCSTRTIFLPIYRHRSARKQYFYQFIVAVRRGNNICAVLSSPRGAETIFLPIYRHRSAREQYFCRFIVAARRGNNIFVVLSSPRGAGTIFLPFYRHRAARERYFCVAALLRALKFLFPPFQNGDVCWNGRGGCPCARPNVRAAAFPYLIDTFSNRKMEGLSFCSKNVVSI